jgi:hypothetical protein
MAHISALKFDIMHIRMRIAEARAFEIIFTFAIAFCLFFIVVGLLINRRNWSWNVRYRYSCGMRTNMLAMLRLLVTRSHTLWLSVMLLTLPLIGTAVFVRLAFRNAVGVRAPFMVAYAGVCLLLWIMFALWILAPPSILLLAASAGSTNVLHGRIGEALSPLKVVSFLRPADGFLEMPEELLRGIQLLRSPSETEWQRDIAHALQNVPTVVVDCRESTENLRAEIELLAKFTSRRQVLLLIGDDASRVACRLREHHDIASFRSEGELISHLCRLHDSRVGWRRVF